MQTKPIFIGLAAGILLLVVAAASFFAGLYLGQRGYVDRLQYQQGSAGLPQSGSPQTGFGAGQPAPSGSNPAGGPPGAPSWPPDVMGRMLSITSTELVLDTPNGNRTVSLDASTRFLDQQGQPLRADQLQMGNVLAVFGLPTASTVMRLPPRPVVP